VDAGTAITHCAKSIDELEDEPGDHDGGGRGAQQEITLECD